MFQRFRISPGRCLWLLTLLVATCLFGASRAKAPLASAAPNRLQSPVLGAAEPADYPGLHNLFRVSEKLISGGMPEGAVGFQSLKSLGIRTVISVDGAQPNLKEARRHGLRYVHLPFGYDGCPTPRALEIVRAVRDLPGQVYIHCHHGKHRSPAASALVQIALDGASNEDAVAFMKRAGTSPGYLGLYGGAASFRRPTAAEIDRASKRFPERVAVPPLAEAMVKIEERVSALQLSQKEGWRVPWEHPDILPSHEALQLMELYRELQRTGEFKTRPTDYQQWMRDGETAAAALQTALKAGDAARADAALKQTTANCGACHTGYRNIPQAR